MNLTNKPKAIDRMGAEIFVRQHARQLNPEEYEIIMTDYPEGTGDFAIVLSDTGESNDETIIAYADYQSDKTDIALSGNLGSGRSIYFGDRYNILGVGKTSLCTSTKPTHSTGRIELIGAMRRIIISSWINHFTPRALYHPILISLKEERIYKWNKNPIPSVLLLRIDDGSLDRPSHVEYSPIIPIDFESILSEYAKIDAEYFAYRIMLGAWSNGNYSMYGHIIDVETISFVRYRGPYHTSTAKYKENLFGYEGYGFIKILIQLAEVKGLPTVMISELFWAYRQDHLAKCFLRLLGVPDSKLNEAFKRHYNIAINLSRQFERLSKKISYREPCLKTYLHISNEIDPGFLDMSELFRNLSNIYSMTDRGSVAFAIIQRKEAFKTIGKDTVPKADNKSETITVTNNFIHANAIISEEGLSTFMSDTRQFISFLFSLLDTLVSEEYLGDQDVWGRRLRAINQDLPTMYELNNILSDLSERYRTGNLSATKLRDEIRRLSSLPSSNFPQALHF